MDHITVVLFEPQNDINIGSVVRVCSNFGVDDLRLVRPASADPERVLISAPNAADAVEALRQFDDLDEALSDCVRVFGATARGRRAARLVIDPVEAAATALQARDSGRVALLFGREDHGLPNEALDRCDAEITIPTSPGYRSLNLAQAVLVLVWEVFRATHLGAEAGQAQLRTEHEPAPREQVERMFETAHDALEQVGFFKYGDGEHVMRSLRSVFNRAQLDERELAIWFGIFKEVLRVTDDDAP